MILSSSCSNRMSCPNFGIMSPPFMHRSSDNNDITGISERKDQSGDRYKHSGERAFIASKTEAVSTFSIDADGASYSNVRRFLLQENRLPPPEAVRTEELLNYFDMDYPEINKDRAVSVDAELSECPWNSSHRLLRLGIKGKTLLKEALPPSNFVFLIDVSGSMDEPDKLKLLKKGFTEFVEQMRETDRLAIVTYAGYSEIALKSTSGKNKEDIIKAIDKLGSGGSTAGAAGIVSAYKIAMENKISGGNNRIILGTDGDFNVGISSSEELVKLMEENRDSGIYLTVLGVGRGNLNDETMEQIADHGNGTYEYIDNEQQLRKVFIDDYNKFYTVAKDVKIQLKFNPGYIDSYRLIGYENRILENHDFQNDKKDAGEIASGQSITAIYELIPGKTLPGHNPHVAIIDFRYKDPATDKVSHFNTEVFDNGLKFSDASDYMHFAAGICSFSMLIRNSPYKGSCNYEKTLEWLGTLQLKESDTYIKEFRDIVQLASRLKS